MSSHCNILRRILSNTKYCSLCYHIISDKESWYDPQDEIMFKTKTFINIHHILITVLGTHVFQTLSIKLICQKCMATLKTCYTFIEMCKNNDEILSHTVKSLLKYVEKSVETDECYKSLFLAVDKNNDSLNLFYDKNEHYNKEDCLKRFQVLQKKKANQELKATESEHKSKNISNMLANTPIKRKKKKRAVQSIHISDIVHENLDENNLKCKYCLKIYPSTLKLKQHYFRVHAPKDFKCTKCPRSFGSSLLLSRHSKDSHCTVVCSQCGKIYNNIYSLRHHEKSHKLHLICENCGKTYKAKQSLNNHIKQNLCQKLRKSNAEAKFTCNYCKKKYSQKTALSVHIRLEHENGKALICDWCGKKLSSLSRLKDHTLKHTKQKNFQCKMCGGKFVTKVSLLYHTRTHTGEKPYQCEHCEMKFLSASRRSEHVKRHHTETDLECDICNGKFKGKTCLMRHRKRHFNTSSRLYCNLK